MTKGFSGFNRYSDLVALIIALMFVLMLVFRGTGGPARFQMTGPIANCAPAAQCIASGTVQA